MPDTYTREQIDEAKLWLTTNDTGDSPSQKRRIGFEAIVLSALDTAERERDALAAYLAEPEPDAEAIAERIEQELCGIEGEPGHESVVLDIPEAAALIEGYGRRVPQWISVKERLPEDDDPIVVTNNIKSWKGHYWLVRGIRLDPNKPDIKYGEYCAWNSFNKIWGVTHWMPLPEPPVGKEGEE